MTQRECNFDLTLPEAASAIGASPKRLRNLLEADEGLRLEEILRPAVPGQAVMIGPHALMRLTVACALADRGLSLKASLNSSARFAFIGESVGFWRGGKQPPIPRWPSMCFPDGKTWLLTADDETLIANIDGQIGRNCFKSVDHAMKQLRLDIAHNRKREESPISWGEVTRIPIVLLELTGIDSWLEDRIKAVLSERRPRNTRLRDSR